MAMHEAWLGILQQLDLLVTIDIRWSETARASDYRAARCDVSGGRPRRGYGRGSPTMRACSTATPCCPCSMTTRVPVGRSLPVWRRRVAWASTSSLRPTIWRLPRWRHLGSIWTSSRSAVGPIRAWRCRRARVSRRFPWMAARLRWQATYGNEPAWVVCPTGSRPWWSLARGCFASLAAIDPLSRIPREGLRRPGAAEAGSDLDAVQMNADAAARMGIADGEIVELVSDMGRDRVRVETTPYLHPACIFTSAAPGGRSFGRRCAVALQALGVGPARPHAAALGPVDGCRAHPGKRRSRGKDRRRARIITSN